MVIGGQQVGHPGVCIQISIGQSSVRHTSSSARQSHREAAGRDPAQALHHRGGAAGVEGEVRPQAVTVAAHGAGPGGAG